MFEITIKQLSVLQDDEERSYLLFAALHETLQLEPYPSEASRAEMFETILFVDKARVSAFLTQKDGCDQAHGGISNFAGQFLRWEQEPPQGGRWFKE